MTPATLDWLEHLRSAHGEGIHAIALFRGVDADVATVALADYDIRTLPEGTMLLQPGEANDTIYILLAGQLAAYLDSALLPETGIPIGLGESVGEMSAIDGKPVSAFVVALTEARVLVLPGVLFWDKLGAIPGVTRNLLAGLSARMRRGNETMLKTQRIQLALEQVRRELHIAHQLQTSMLPLRGRLFPERADIEVAGLMNPASEVGGDFFDAFFVDDRYLFFCIGDVSGHGIAAALFMARTVGLIRITAMSTRDPHRLLARVNDQLCAGNDANIFVTLFAAFLDVTSGALIYSNAGHCAPLLARQDGASWLPMHKGALLGILPGARYKASELDLETGVSLVCYTDGVVEAESAAGGEFSRERLLSVSAANAAEPIDALLASVELDLARFLDGAAADDDCTLVAVRRPGRGPS